MRKAVLFQCGAMLLIVILSGLFAGPSGAVSAALAAVSVLVPNLWFAWRLKAASKRPGVASAVRFLSGELVKIAVSAGLLIAVAECYPDLHWPSFLLGLLVVLQASFLAFWKNP